MMPMVQGGILTQEISQQRRNAGLPAGVIDETWGWVAEDSELFFREAAYWHVFTWDSLSLILRGVARTPDCADEHDPERVAEELRCQYLERGRIHTEELHGSYTVALLDGHAQRVLLYRSLLSTHGLYYHASRDGLIFGEHVADVLGTSLLLPRLRTSALPAYFAYGFSATGETLLDGVDRVMPGEQLCWERGVLTRSQRETFAALANAGDSPDHIDLALSEILHDHGADRAGLGTLLTGGPNSRRLQEAVNRMTNELLPASFSTSFDHPTDWGTTDVAMQASRSLGTRHHFSEIPADLGETLRRFIERTGEIPVDSSALVMASLAESASARSIRTLLSGAGASALLAPDIVAQSDALDRLGTLLPFRWMRRAIGSLATATGYDDFASRLWLLDHQDDSTSPRHPLNLLDQSVPTETLIDLFGKTTIRRMQGDRRAVLDRLGVPTTMPERLRAMRLLGQTLPSASLSGLTFDCHGLDYCCPYLDSRVARLSAMSGSTTHTSVEGWASSDGSESGSARNEILCEALSPGGSLSPLVEQIEAPDFLDPRGFDRIRQTPSVLLYRLLCLDLWRKTVLERTLTPTDSIRPNVVETVAQPDLGAA